ncbi:MAG: DUF167 domain-containing protein [Candidatus Woesearchaeota archaeon]|jgi:uncharacterized protein (TIGR00251 family)|nr:DUF167 domain-containing protein [Candidatus Woesearchaeota archaeon]
MSNFPKFSFNQFIKIKAKPKSSKSELIWDNENEMILAFLHSIPDDNKANEELIKLFKKQLKLRVELTSGFKSKDKKVKVI